jgi:hypothetical protein
LDKNQESELQSEGRAGRLVQAGWVRNSEESLFSGERCAMNPLILASLLLVSLFVGCARPPLPQSSLTGKITEVKIGEVLTPEVIEVEAGDEVKWVNMTNSRVHVSLEKRTTASLSCRRGFVFEEGYPVGPPATSVISSPFLVPRSTAISLPVSALPRQVYTNTPCEL